MDWHFPAMSNQMRAEIIKLRQKINTTFIYVTHDPEISYVSGGHLSTVLKTDDYIGVIRGFLNKR